MKLLTTILTELFGLFVDDGSLAVGILAIVGLLAFAISFGLPAVVAGPLLFAACALLLAENVARTLRSGK